MTQRNALLLTAALALLAGPVVAQTTKSTADGIAEYREMLLSDDLTGLAHAIFRFLDPLAAGC